MHVLLPLIGALVVLAVAQDVFSSVLFPSSGHGVIRKPLARLVWRVFWLLGRSTQGQRRRNVLSYNGPAQIVATIGVWFLLLLLGWACIYQPALGTSITASKGATDTGFATAVYVSGYTVTTLGTGDVVAQTSAYRLLMILEAGSGFITFTLVISYFLSVYSQLPPRNTFAQGLHDRSRQTDDAAELVAALAQGDQLGRLQEEIEGMASFLRRTAQTHRFYPVLRYFHYRRSYYGLPQVLLMALDTASLLRAALDGGRYPELRRSAEVDSVLLAGKDLLQELVPRAQPRSPEAEEEARWRRRYDDACRRLDREGLVVRQDAGAGQDEYVRLRSGWDAQLDRLAVAMLHEWPSGTAADGSS